MSKNNKENLLRERAIAKLKEDAVSLDIPSSKKDIENFIYELQIQNMQLQLEKEEKEQEDYRWRYILEKDSDVIIAADTEGAIMYANQYGEGLSAEKVVGLNILDFMPNEEMKTLTKKAINKVLQTKDFVEFENEAIADGQGTVRSFCNKVSPLFKENGELEGILLKGRDVTDLHKTEQELLLLEEQFKAITQQHFQAITIADLEGNYTFVNPAFCDMMGYTEQELLRMTVFDMKGNPSSEEVFNTAKNGATVRKVSLKRKDGSIFLSRVNGKPINIAGKPFVLGVVADITEEEKKGEELEQSKNQAESLFELSPDLMFKIKIDDLTFAAVNQQVVDNYGYTKEEFLELSVYDIEANPSSLDFAKKLREKLDIAKTVQLEGLHKRKDGSTFLVSINVGQLDNDFIVAAVRDITGIKENEVNLNFAKETLELALEGSSAGAWDWTSIGDEAMWCSPQFYRLLGYERNEILFTTSLLTEWHHPSQRERVLAMMKSHFLNDTPYDIEVQIKTKSGAYKWFRATGQAKRDANGKALRMVGSIVSIEERKKIEEKNKYYQSLLEQSQQIAKIGSWELDLVRNILTWTDENYRVFGVPLRTPLSYDVFLNQIHPDDRNYVNEEWSKAVSQNAVYDIEHRLVINGKTKWVREKATIYYGEDGLPVNAIGFTQDITKFKKVEAELKENQNYLKRGAELAKFGFWKLCPETGAVEGTEELLDIFEIREELTLEKFAKTFHPEDSEYIISNINRGIAEGVPWDIKYRIRFEKDRIKWVHAKGEPFLDKDFKTIYIVGVVQDITKEKIAELAVEESEQRYRDLFDNINDGIGMLDANGSVLYCNQAYAKICGYADAESMKGVLIPDIVHPEDKVSSQEAFKELTEKGVYEGYEGRILHEDKTMTWVRVSSTAIYNDKGELVGSRDVTRDITSTKRANLKLKETKNQFENLFELSPDFMFKSRVDDFKLVDVNQRACDFYGYTKEEFKNLYVEDIQTCLGRGYDHIPIGHVVEVERSHRKKDGTIFPVYISYCKLDEEYVLAIARDITVRKQASKEVNDLKYALDEASIVVIMDNDGKILSVNDKFCKISKYSKEELIGSTHKILNSDYHPTSFWKEVWDTISMGNVWSGEIKNKAKDGSYYWTQSSIIPFLDELGNPIQYIAIRTDITEQKALEKALRAAKEEADKNARIKENFLANMSHEIRTPMNGVFGFSRLLLQTKVDSTQQKYAQSIYSSAENLLAVINDILDVSKMESGKFEIKNSDFDLADKIKSVLKILQVSLDQKGLGLIVEIDEKIPSCIVAAPNRIGQVLINLVGNAIKFTEKGKIHLKVHLQEEKVLLFEVVDTGIGIPEDKWDTVFDSFMQIESYITREYEGTGLGLSISKELVRLMGGEIALKSEVGKGSTFYFTIPFEFCKEVKESSTFKENVLLKHLKVNDGVKVLVAEDHPVNQELAIIYLGLLNCSYELVENGKDAVEKAANTKFDIILMDIQMPQMDGIEATRQIRAFDKDTPIIAMTAHALEKEKQGCLDIGMNDYLTKPFKAEELEEFIIKYVKKETQKIKSLVKVLTKETDAKPIFSEVLAEMGGNQNLVNDLLSIFKVELVRFIDEMGLAIDLEDWAQMRGLKHRIKPSFDLFRLTEQKEYLTTISTLIEEQNNISEIKSHFQLLEATIPQLLKEIDIELLKSTN